MNGLGASKAVKATNTDGQTDGKATHPRLSHLFIYLSLDLYPDELQGKGCVCVFLSLSSIRSTEEQQNNLILLNQADCIFAFLSMLYILLKTKGNCLEKKYTFETRDACPCSHPSRYIPGWHKSFSSL